MPNASHRLALLAACAGLAACTAQPRYPIEPGQAEGSGGFGTVPPHYPVTQSAPPPAPRPAPPPPPRDDDAPRAAPSGSVDSTPLPPPTPGGGSSGAQPYRSASTGIYRRPPSAASEGREAAASLRGAPTGPVQVQPFENLAEVGERVHTPVRVLAEVNGLHPPYGVQAGTVLKAPAGAAYSLSEGDTLYGIGRRFGVEPRTLATFNEITFETLLRPGRRLLLPGRPEDKGVEAGARGELVEERAPRRPAEELRLAQAPATAPEAVPSRPPAEAPPARPVAAAEPDVPALARGRFAWPLRGEVISSFGPKGPGQRNDGVNIAAASGESVRAAAAGVVVYAGNSIPAFGNLVLVKHPGGWATLYGNLGRISVTPNAQVAQGQEIGTAGMSGAVDRPQVHFEIRYAADPHDKARPYDPILLLPSAS